MLAIGLLSALAAAACSRGQSQAAPPPAEDPTRWEGEVRRLEQRDRATPPPKGGVVFVGGSSVRMWKTLQQDMSPMPVVRRGFGGARTKDVLHYAKRLVLPHRPRAVVYYAGDNDLGRKRAPAPDTIQEDFARFVQVIRGAGQSPEFYFVSIKPSPRRMRFYGQMQRANALVERYTVGEHGVTYVDVASPMLDERGQPRRELFTRDGLHLSQEGYALWSNLLKPILQSQVGPNPLYL